MDPNIERLTALGLSAAQAKRIFYDTGKTICEMDKEPTVRGEILGNARDLTEGDRNRTYGDPFDNLTCYAKMADAYLNALPTVRVGLKPGDPPHFKRWQTAPLDATDAAILMVLAKVSRVAANKQHRDNYVDMAAYAAIAGECAERGHNATHG